MAEKTNVKSSLFGRGVVKNVALELDLGRFTVCTMDIPWRLTKDLLGASPIAVVMVDCMEEAVVDNQLQGVPECDAFVGIGGGQAVDLAKYFAWKRARRLVTIPTVLSVDAFVTPAAGIRRGGDVVYLGESSPDPLVIDYDLIRTAPAQLNVAGVGDLLSIHTATYDWELANAHGKSEYDFAQQSITDARSILSNILSKAEDIKNVTDDGIRAIVDGYMQVNSICIPAGHYRVEEGSEHFLFYALEKRFKKSYIHGHVIGLGIFIMSRLQENKADKIISFMDDLGLCYHPKHLGLTEKDLKDTLLNLKEFVSGRNDLWFSVVNVAELTDETVEHLTRGLIYS